MGDALRCRHYPTGDVDPEHVQVNRHPRHPKIKVGGFTAEVEQHTAVGAERLSGEPATEGLVAIRHSQTKGSPADLSDNGLGGRSAQVARDRQKKHPHQQSDNISHNTTLSAVVILLGIHLLAYLKISATVAGMHPLEPLIVHLKKGLPALIPFDTCYGFVCDGIRREACALLYELKGRPPTQPSALVVPDIETIENYAEVSPTQRRILKQLLPGAVTVILRLKDGVDLPGGYVQTKYRTASFRVVKSQLIDEILMRLKKPLLTTSANYEARPVILSHTDLIMQPFDRRLLDKLYRLDTEVYQKPSHSTVIDLTTDVPEIVRPGATPTERIRLAALR